MAIHFCILGWRVPWTEKSGSLQSIGLQRVGHDWSNLEHTHIYVSVKYKNKCYNVTQYPFQTLVSLTEPQFFSIYLSLIGSMTSYSFFSFSRSAQRRIRYSVLAHRSAGEAFLGLWRWASHSYAGMCEMERLQFFRDSGKNQLRCWGLQKRKNWVPLIEHYWIPWLMK